MLRPGIHSVTPDLFRSPPFRAIQPVEPVERWMPERARHD